MDTQMRARAEEFRAHLAAEHECCASCRNFTPVEGLCGDCSQVQGPSPCGHVDARARCVLYERAGA